MEGTRGLRTVSGFQLADWSVQPQLNLLEHSGKRCRLEPRVMDVLVYLAEHHNTVVSKEKIIHAVWRGSYVTDHVLLRAISTLRKVFGDDVHDPRFIETIPKSGYRLIAPIKVSLESQKDTESAFRRKPLGGLAVLLVFLAVLIALVWLFRTETTDDSAELRVSPLTSYPGLERNPSLSPGGDRAVYSWNGPKEDDFDLYIHQIGLEEPLRMTADPAQDLNPVWSPDGSTIAFLRRGAGRDVELRLIPSFGQADGRLLRRVDSTTGLAWTPDSRWVALTDRPSPEEARAIFLVSVETAERMQLTYPPEGAADFDPAITGNGQYLAFSRRVGTITSQLYILELSEDHQPIGEPRQITHETEICLSPAWTQRGDSIVFSRGSGQKRELYQVSISDERVRRLPVPGSGWDPAISTKGNVLVYADVTYDGDIWRDQLTADQRQESGQFETFISSTRWDSSPAYSTDGERIVFVSERSGKREIWTCDQDGTNLVSLGSPEINLPSWPAWSPKGRRIAFVDRIQGNSDIFVVNFQGGPPLRLTTHVSVDNFPSWSKSGEWIYFRSNRTGANQIWKIRSEGGTPQQVTANGGLFALEALDGKSLYFTKRAHDHGQALWKVGLDGREEVEAAESRLGSRGFCLANGGFYFVSGRRIWFQKFDSKDLQNVGRYNSLESVERISVSPDGRSVLLSEGRMSGSDLMLVEDFGE